MVAKKSVPALPSPPLGTARIVIAPKPTAPSQIVRVPAILHRPASGIDINNGRDELNLADLPLSFLSEKTSKEISLREIDNGVGGQLTVTPNSHYGWPNVVDDDVLLALISLNRQVNDFQDCRFEFTRQELFDILRWNNNGKSYDRLEKSIQIWSSLHLKSTGLWWHKGRQERLNHQFHIIDQAWLCGSKNDWRHTKNGQLLCWIDWSETFLGSCQAGNLRKINLETHFGLKTPIAKRLNRFLGKWFYNRSEFEIDLHELAYRYLGLLPTSTYQKNAGKIKQALLPGIQELESVRESLLGKLDETERFQQIARGRWKVRFTQPSLPASPMKILTAQPLLDQCQLPQPKTSVPKIEIDLKSKAHEQTKETIVLPTSAAREQTKETIVLPTSATIQRLLVRGVNRAQAERLVATFPETHIQEKIAIFDWLKSQRQAAIASNPPGWLIASIEKNFEVPEGYQRQQKRHEQTQQRQRAQGDLHAQALQAEIVRLQTSELNQMIAAMSPLDREQLKEAALKNTSDEMRKFCGDPGIGQMMLQTVMREELVRRLN